MLVIYSIESIFSLLFIMKGNLSIQRLFFLLYFGSIHYSSLEIQFNEGREFVVYVYEFFFFEIIFELIDNI